VRVNNFHVHWSGGPFGPFEANSPPVVDSNAVLTLAVTFQRLKAVARQDGEVLEGDDRFKSVDLKPHGPLDAGKRLHPFVGGEIRRPLVAIADDRS